MSSAVESGPEQRVDGRPRLVGVADRSRPRDWSGTYESLRSVLAAFMAMTPVQRWLMQPAMDRLDVHGRAGSEGVVSRDVEVHGAGRGALPRGRTRRRSTLCRSRETSLAARFQSSRGPNVVTRRGYRSYARCLPLSRTLPAAARALDPRSSSWLLSRPHFADFDRPLRRMLFERRGCGVTSSIADSRTGHRASSVPRALAIGPDLSARRRRAESSSASGAQAPRVRPGHQVTEP